MGPASKISPGRGLDRWFDGGDEHWNSFLFIKIVDVKDRAYIQSGSKVFDSCKYRALCAVGDNQWHCVLGGIALR